jgi:hypothetical protein
VEKRLFPKDELTYKHIYAISLSGQTETEKEMLPKR